MNRGRLPSDGVAFESVWPTLHSEGCTNRLGFYMNLLAGAWRKTDLDTNGHVGHFEVSVREPKEVRLAAVDEHQPECEPADPKEEDQSYEGLRYWIHMTIVHPCRAVHSVVIHARWEHKTVRVVCTTKAQISRPPANFLTEPCCSIGVCCSVLVKQSVTRFTGTIMYCKYLWTCISRKRMSLALQEATVRCATGTILDFWVKCEEIAKVRFVLKAAGIASASASDPGLKR